MFDIFDNVKSTFVSPLQQKYDTKDDTKPERKFEKKSPIHATKMIKQLFGKIKI